MNLDFSIKYRDYGTVPWATPMETILREAMESKRTMELGLYYGSGIHMYITYRYEKTANFGCIIVFDA